MLVIDSDLDKKINNVIDTKTVYLKKNATNHVKRISRNFTKSHNRGDDRKRTRALT